MMVRVSGLLLLGALVLCAWLVQEAAGAKATGSSSSSSSSGRRSKTKGKAKGKVKGKAKGKSSSSAQRSSRLGSPFLLQSLADKWECFAGDRFSRCGLETLWYQSGSVSSGINFQLRPVDEKISMSSSSNQGASETAVCLVRKSCDPMVEEYMHVTVGSCQQVCSANKWALENEGKSDVAVITFNNTQNCVTHDAKRNIFLLDKCVESTYTKMIQIKASKMDLNAMNATGHRMVNAVLQGNSEAITEFFQNKVDVNMRNWEDSTLLHAAAAANDIATVKYLVETQKADVNVIDRHHYTPLMEASKTGSRDIVDFLLSSGAEADPVDLSGTSALMLAAEKGHSSVTEFLLEQHSVDVNRQDARGVHSLGKACKENHLEVVKILVSAGANIDLMTNEGSSALTMALETERDTIKIIDFLLEKNADVNNKDGVKEATVPLSMAAYMGKDAVAELLLKKGALVNYANSENITALMYAASGGWDKVVRLLLDNGADIHTKHKEGATALFEAVVNGSLPIVEMLLAANADFLVTDKDNITMLHTAAEAGHTKICEQLLDRGISINLMASPGTTPLMHAVYLDREETVRLLLDRKADVNILVEASQKYKDDNALERLQDPSVELYEHHLSALMIACKQGYLNIAKMLVEAGATVTIKDDNNVTALVHAATAPKNSEELMSLLVEYGADPDDEIITSTATNSVLLHSIVNNYTALAISLIAKGASVSFIDGDGLTVATHAAFLGQHRVVEEIIARGGDLGAGSNSEGTDPLIAASAEGHLEVVQSLLKSGRVDLTGRDIDGTNALMAASVRGHKAVASLLVKAGVNVNSQNVEGHTALMFAYNGKTQVELLLAKYREYTKASNDNSTKILQDALSSHSDIIKLLLRSGADASIPDNLGHLGSDFESFSVKDNEVSLN